MAAQLRIVFLMVADLWLRASAGGALQDSQNCRIGVLCLRGGGVASADCVQSQCMPTGVREALAGTLSAARLPAVRLSIAAPPCLHLGHARAALLNDYIARNFNGSLLVRFEDPLGGLPGDQEAVLRELALIGVRVDQTSRASDHLHILAAACERAIREGRAYVDEGEAGDSRKTEPAARSSTVSDNLARWAEMIAGRARYCVRARLDTDSPNLLMRDPILFYCPASSPQRTEDKSPCCCPSIAFSVPVLDHAEGITCVLLSSHPAGRAEQYTAMCEIAGIRSTPDLLLAGRLTHLSETPLSARFLCNAISAGLATGYDDARLPTVRGLMRQGLAPKALHAFSLFTSGLRSARDDQKVRVSRGVSENARDGRSGDYFGRGIGAGVGRVHLQGVDVHGVAEESLLWQINRQLLLSPPAGACRRFTALEVDGICRVMLRNIGEESEEAAHGRASGGGRQGVGKGGGSEGSKGEERNSGLATVLLQEYDADSLKEGDKMTLLGWTSAHHGYGGGGNGGGGANEQGRRPLGEGAGASDEDRQDSAKRIGQRTHSTASTFYEDQEDSGKRVGHFRVTSMQFDREGKAVRILADLLSQNPDLETTKNFCWLPDLLPAASHQGSDVYSQSVHTKGGATLVSVMLQYETPVTWQHLARLVPASALERDDDADDEGFVCCDPRRTSTSRRSPILQGHEAIAREGEGGGGGGGVGGGGAYGENRRLVAAVGEGAMRGLKQGDVIELPQKGFFRVDCVSDDTGGGGSGGGGAGIRLISIPSGRVVRRYLSQAAGASSSSDDEYDDVAQDELAEERDGIGYRS
jgi:hypothetical protein